jgi:hypothetical protein
MLEKSIENYFKKQLQKHGALVIKMNTYHFRGFPDRMILLPEGRIFFAELKRPGEKPRANQKVVHRMLRKLGFKVYVIDCKEQVEEVIRDEVHSSQVSGSGYQTHI